MMNYLKVACFTAQPQESQLNTEVELAALRQVFAPFQRLGWVRFYWDYDGQFNALRELVRGEEWDLVIVCGHGGGKREAVFIAEDAVGNAFSVGLQAFVEVFRQARVGCVLLSVCHSVELARALFQVGVPHVVGMAGEVLERGSVLFSSAFCRAVVQGETVADAVAQGRQALQQLLDVKEVWYGASVDWVAQVDLPRLLSVCPAGRLCVAGRVVREDFGDLLVSLRSLTPFVGRRLLLREAGCALRLGKWRCVNITGKSGWGKTAFAGEMVGYLEARGYRHLEKDEPIQDFTYVWLDKDRVSCLSVSQLLQLRRGVNGHFCVVMSHAMGIRGIHAQVLALPPLTFGDFTRYLHSQGLPYSAGEMASLYLVLQGNLHGVRLLCSTPLPQSADEFAVYLQRLRRYVRAF